MEGSARAQQLGADRPDRGRNLALGAPRLQPDPHWILVVVHMRGAVVLRQLLALVVLLVCVNQGRVVVLVLVVLGPMLELAQRAAGVVVRHVIVVVGMNVPGMGVLLFPHHHLVACDARVLIHG